MSLQTTIGDQRFRATLTDSPDVGEVGYYAPGNDLEER